MRLISTRWIGLLAVSVLWANSTAHAESKHVFGIAFFGGGANVDVFSHRTGWVTEANTTHGGARPNVGHRYRGSTGQALTMIQRLDWKWEQTIPLKEPDMDQFADDCANNWARQIKKYCRHYSIGNEVEFFDVTALIYAQCFTKVRNAIKAVQPQAQVHIGHMNNVNRQQSVMEMLGPDGYDGVTAHVGSHVPTGQLDALDNAGARPGVGVYITEWGWVPGTNPNAMEVMRRFAEDLGESNASRERQVYAACWFVYPANIGWDWAALELSPIDNEAFEAATALGVDINSYAVYPITMSEMIADIPDVGTSVNCSWRTNVRAQRQIWWMPVGQTDGTNNDLNTTLSYTHQETISELTPGTAYEIMPISTRIGYADANGRRFKVQTGPWGSHADQVVGAGNAMRVTWSTQFPADSRVAYGTTAALGSWGIDDEPVTEHEIILRNLNAGLHYYRILSCEPNPDGGDSLKMRSPLRFFSVVPRVPGDFDDDGDVDLEDFGLFQMCLTGPGIAQEDERCKPARLDIDEDVDADDFGIFQACLSGANIPGDPECAG